MPETMQSYKWLAAKLCNFFIVTIIIIIIIYVFFYCYIKKYCFYPVRSQLWHLVQMCIIPAKMNTSDSWAVNTPSATCQLWLMSNARSGSPSSILSVPQTHTNCNHCRPLAYIHSSPHTYTPPATHRQLGRHSPGSAPWEEHRGRWTGRSCQWGRRDTESASHFK